jgi:hypothetical protein
MSDETHGQRPRDRVDTGAASLTEQQPREPGPRSRFHWHASTSFVATLVVAWIALLNVPGSRGGNDTRLHGWPWVYLTRGATLYLAKNRMEYPGIWSIWGDVLVFHPIPLFVNVCVALIVAVGCAAVFERWRRRRERLFHFSLRSVMLVVVVCSVPMGYVAHRARVYRERQEVLEGFGEGEQTVECASILPEWQRGLIGSLLGEDFGAILDDQELMLLNPYVIDKAHIALVVRLPTLKYLFLEGRCYISGDSLAQLDSLPQLEMLGLSSLNLSDATLSQLPVLQRLQSIGLECKADAHITDAGLLYLMRHPMLRSISLKNTSVTAAGIEQFKHEVGRKVQIILR